MCGLIAQINSLSDFPPGLLTHRGPDQDFHFRSYNTHVEYFRLAITGGIQGESPVYSKNRKWVVFLNGEIYNFRSLQVSHGLPHTNSDTQVIADGLEKFGIRFLTYLRGMFAGLIFDLENNQLYVFRDPLGEKPLFFSIENGVLSIASEFRALLKVLDRELMFNEEAAASYFRFGYAEEPLTFDLLIKPFPKGHVISYNLTTLVPKVELILLGYSDVETSMPLDQLLDNVLDEQLAVDVPAGLALSGGVDSNALLMAKSIRSIENFKPLIVDLPSNPGLSEAPMATASCKRLGITPTILNLEFDDLPHKLSKLATINDQPHADPSGLSYSQIFAHAQAMDLKVVFLGHGPDEFFWGYPWLTDQLRKSQSGKLLHRFQGKQPRPFWSTPALTSRFIKDKLDSLLPVPSFGSEDEFLASSNLWEKTRAFVTHSYLSDNGLRQSDRLAMAHSIEPRTPFADSRLYGWSQFNSVKDSSSFDKSEFRNAVELGVNSILKTRRKQGFASPFHNWFLENSVRELLRNAASEIESINISWLDKIQIRRLNTQESYRILMLGLWLHNLRTDEILI
jgi:asparagine synthase (glutamine-hydrolysing)